MTTGLVVDHVEESDATGRASYRDEGLALVDVAAPRRILKHTIINCSAILKILTTPTK